MEADEIVQQMHRHLASPHEDLQIVVRVVQSTDLPKHTWELRIDIKNTRADHGQCLPTIVRGFKTAVEVIERWPRGMVPGELSRTVHTEKYLRGLRITSLTAKARDYQRWIEYRLDHHQKPSAWINLSTSQALQVAGQLEEAPQVAQEMISFLRSLDEV